MDPTHNKGQNELKFMCICVHMLGALYLENMPNGQELLSVVLLVTLWEALADAIYIICIYMQHAGHCCNINPFIATYMYIHVAYW